jgi:hypothetical protein
MLQFVVSTVRQVAGIYHAQWAARVTGKTIE